jgi:hypothetical protein
MTTYRFNWSNMPVDQELLAHVCDCVFAEREAQSMTKCNRLDEVLDKILREYKQQCKADLHGE